MATKHGVAAVEKAIQILNYIASNPGATFTQIFTDLDISKSTVYQTLFTLESYQYVNLTSDKKYQIGVGILPLFNGVSQPEDLVSLSHDLLTEYSEETGLTIHLCAMADPLKAVCLYKIDGATFTIKTTAPGRELIMHTSAAAKALLAYLPHDQQVACISSISFDKYTDTTITSPVAFRQDLALTKKRGYSIDNCESALGAIGIGVPVFDKGNNVIASLSLGAVMLEIPESGYESAAHKLQSLSSRITSRLPG